VGRSGLPSIISQIPLDLRQFLDRVREFIDTAKRGDMAFVTREDLLDSGIATPGPGDTLLPVAYVLDTTPPPTPSGLFAAGTLTSIYLAWDAPGYANHGYTLVWRSQDNNFSNAVEVGSSASRLFTDSTGMGVAAYYWIQFVSKAGVAGPVIGNGTGQNGVFASTSGTVPGSLIAAESITGDKILAGEILASHIYTPTLDAITADLGDITAGTITLDNAGFLRSGNIAYFNGNGFWMGYHIDAYKMFIGDDGGEYLDWNGTNLTINTPEFHLSGGNATFSGDLSAATGTFAGSLNAATGTFTGSLQAATGTFAGSLQAADGLFSGQLLAATGTFAGSLAAGVINSSAFDSLRYEYASPGSFELTIPAMNAGWTSMKMRVTVQGAGGGGGGGGRGLFWNGEDWVSFFGGGGGGGAGSRVVYDNIACTPGQGVSITVGAGGLPGTSAYSDNASNGLSGGATSVYYGTSYTATAGTGGGKSSSSNAAGVGGVLGGGNGSASDSIGSGGRGGASQYGVGGQGGYVNAQGPVPAVSGGLGCGGGGGGSTANFLVPPASGGPGYVLIEFYDPNTIVLNSRYSNLITWLDSIGHGAVPENAR